MTKAMLVGILALVAAPLAWGAEAKATLAIRGMTCGGCVAAVNLQLKRTDGVTAYEVSYEKAEAQVTYDPARTNPNKIAESVSKTGFVATVSGGTAGTGAALHGPSCKEDWCKSARAVGPSKETTAAGLVSLASDGASAASSSSSVLSAPQVRQYWDPQRRVGAALRNNIFPDAAARMKGSVPKGHFMADHIGERDASQPEWDIYLLYDAGIEWKGSVPAPTGWVRQVALYTQPAAGGAVRSLMWKNDYAATPVEGTLVQELRALMAGAHRAAAIR